MSRFIPYVLKWDDAPLDISFVFGDQKPAGSHGFLTMSGDKFIFEDGETAHFWGTLFNSGMNFCTHEHAEKTARRLAKFGVNIVRLHQLDSEWALPNIFTFERGGHEDQTTEFDARSMERLDYLTFCLKQNGIHLYMDGINYRRFKTKDGVGAAPELGTAGKPYNLFDRRMIELQKKYNRDLMCHFNPYTGLRYCDDPMVCFFALTTECSLLSASWKIVLEPYRTKFEQLFRAWAEENDICIPAGPIDVNDGSDKTAMSFRIKLMSDCYGEMAADLRDNGVKIPLCGDNWIISLADARAKINRQFFTDTHAYWAFGDQRHFRNDLMAGKRMALFDNHIKGRYGARPFFASEWDAPWPNEFRADAAILGAATGRLQGWGGMTVHTYRYGSREEEAITRRISRDLVLGNSYYRGIFDTYNDPAKFGLFYHAALIMRRGDVQEAKKVLGVRMPMPADSTDSTFRFNALPGLAAVHKTMLFFEDMADQVDEIIPAEQNSIPEDAELILSDTGELCRDTRRQLGWVDTALTKAVYGMIGGQKISLNGLTIDGETDFATIAISSLTAEPIAQSGNLLLTAVGRAHNTGYQYRKNENGTYAITDSGQPPMIIEVIEAKITLATARRDLRIVSINDEGFITGTIPYTYSDDNQAISFEIGKEFAQMYYLIQAQ